MKKDDQEIATLREAARLSDLAMAASLDACAVGVSELESETQGLVALRGAAAERGEGSIVDVISLIIGGPRGAMPHEFTTGRPYGSGELMWHCWLVAYQGYWVENVRTGIVGGTATGTTRRSRLFLRASWRARTRPGQAPSPGTSSAR